MSAITRRLLFLTWYGDTKRKLYCVTVLIVTRSCFLWGESGSYFFACLFMASLFLLEKHL